MGLFGIEIGPSIDSLASDYAFSHQLGTSGFSSKQALDTKLGDMYDECARYVHAQNSLHGQKNSYGPCKSAIDSRNAAVIKYFTDQESAEDSQLKAAALSSDKKLYVIVAIVLIVMVTIAIIFKTKFKK